MDDKMVAELEERVSGLERYLSWIRDYLVLNKVIDGVDEVTEDLSVLLEDPTVDEDRLTVLERQVKFLYWVLNLDKNVDFASYKDNPFPEGMLVDSEEDA